MTDTIQNRFREVKEKIAYACSISNRKVEAVNLVVVTKGHSIGEMIEVYEAGAVILGENYPEETLKKVEILNGRIKPKWHMIGHLQSRKIKILFPHFEMIHSIDSKESANKLNNYCRTNGLSIDALIEVNISGEASKYGFDGSTSAKRNLLISEIESLAALECVRFRGLMTMPPFATSETQNKKCYNLCYELLSKAKDRFGDPLFCELSMGTSADFSTAISEGATYIRIGEAIMGPRTYKIQD